MAKVGSQECFNSCGEEVVGFDQRPNCGAGLSMVVLVVGISCFLLRLMRLAEKRWHMRTRRVVDRQEAWVCQPPLHIYSRVGVESQLWCRDETVFALVLGSRIQVSDAVVSRIGWKLRVR